MLLDWFTYIGLTIVVFGWGLLFWKMASFFIGLQSGFPLWGEIGFYGLFGIGLMVIFFNFFFPINIPFLIFFVVTGLVLFCGFLHRDCKVRTTLTKSFFSISLTISFFLTLFAAFNRFDYDAGLYHIPYQLWIRKEPVVLGLANLHDRFGYNSILDAIFSGFWLPNNNFILVCYVQSFFFFFFFLAILEFFLRGPVNYGGFALFFSLFSPLSIVMLDDYVVYRITSTDTPPALVALLGVFSFLRLADRWRTDENVEAEFLSLNVLAVFAITLKLSMVPVLVLVASSYFLLLAKSPFKWPFLTRMALLSGLTLMPTISRNLAVSGCGFFPIAFTCLGELPWSAEPIAKDHARIISAWARVPGEGFLMYQTGWEWVPRWVENNAELLLLLIPTTIVIFACGYFYSSDTYKHHSPLEPSEIPINRFRYTFVIPLVIFESVALAFWFLMAPDPRFGILPLHMLTLLPALLTVLIIRVEPEGTSSRSFWHRGVGIVLIGICLWKMSDPTQKSLMHQSHLIKGSLSVPSVETVPNPPHRVHPVKPDVVSCWVIEEPCSPSYSSLDRNYDIARIGPFKAFIPR